MQRIIPPPKKCIRCGKVFERDPNKSIFDFSEKRFCTKKCYQKSMKRENHPNWKGGIKHRPDGYQRDSATDQYIHRQVMEKHLGRKLKSSEHIHHIDGNNKNNNVKNLKIVTNSEHQKIEYKLRKIDKYGRFA